jgi:hypothetical protein
MLSRMMFLLKIVVEQSKFIDKKLAIIMWHLLQVGKPEFTIWFSYSEG